MIEHTWRGQVVRVLAGAVLCATALACGRGEQQQGDSATVIPAGAPSMASSGDTAGGVRTDSGCVLAGPWSECNLLNRLESAGVAPRRAQGTIRQPFLSVPGIVFAVGSSELQAYIYPDTLALQRDFAKLDTIRVAPPTMQVSWRATPNLIRSNNLMAILLSNDETQVERVRNAITAGLPLLPAH